MRPTNSTWLSLTFFTKQTCQLCKNAHGVLGSVLQRPEFATVPLTTVDIEQPENKKAFDKYCFDVPVLHVDRAGHKTVKFMHYFDEAKIVEALSAARRD